MKSCRRCGAALADAPAEETHDDWHEHLRTLLLAAAPHVRGLAPIDVRSL